MKKIKRSLKVSLRFSNKDKLVNLNSLWVEYKKAVNDFVLLIPTRELTEEYIKEYDSELSYRYKQCAKRQAMNMYKAWKARNKKSLRKCSMPILRRDSMVLDSRFAQVQQKNDTKLYDYWIKISTLTKGRPMLIPVKSYDYLNKYFDSWSLVNGIKLMRTEAGDWFAILVFEKEIELKKKDNNVLGVDIGYRKLITTSTNNIYGKEINKLCVLGTTKEQYSKSDLRLRKTIEYYINESVKNMFKTEKFSVLYIEDLKNLKKDKHGKWSKKVNRLFSYWKYSNILKRLEELCEVNGVQICKVNPSYSSQMCPMCGHIERSNRNGEKFKCRSCDYANDADYVGALNILSYQFGQEFMVPVEQGTKQWQQKAI